VFEGEMDFVGIDISQWRTARRARTLAGPRRS
jgi:hypothetical protein